MLRRTRKFFTDGGSRAWSLVGCATLLFVLTGALVSSTASVRYERDVTRMVFNDNLGLLEEIKRKVGATSDTLAQVLAEGAEPPADQPYVVVSIADHRLWYKQGANVLYSTQVATGSGKILTKGTGAQWKFETPRGRLVVQGKESDPVWVPPDWHYVETSKKHGLGLVRLNRGQTVPIGDGSVILVSGNDVVRRFPDGRLEPYETGEGKEIVVGKKVVVPPFGTNQRKFAGVVGTHRLNLGDGYALHGTDEPTSIGRSVSHGCVRLRNEDIETLYRMVPVGTPVFIY